MGDQSATDAVTFTKVPLIPCEKLTGTENYNIWAGAVKLWFQGQGVADHLTKQSREISTAHRTKWKQVDASLCTVLWFSIAPNLQAQYQAFTTCYEVWEKAKKVFSNDVHRLYSVVLSLNSLKLENMDMQAYLSKLDSLKANFTSLMPFTSDATAHAEQRSKFFMIMALVGLPPELDSVRNQILSGSTVPDYDSVSEQLLRLATPHAFGPASTPSPTESSALASHYRGRGGRNGGRGGQRHSIRCNYCTRYGHI
jgi:predicted GNAT family acetyltransferase